MLMIAAGWLSRNLLFSFFILIRQLADLIPLTQSLRDFLLLSAEFKRLSR